VSILCKNPLIVPTQAEKLQIEVEMAHGQNIPEDTIIKFAQEYCYNNIHDSKCEPLNLYDLRTYIMGKTLEHGVKKIIITTPDDEEIITPGKDEWCLIHRDNVDFYRI
jgi:hypothetical protein